MNAAPFFSQCWAGAAFVGALVGCGRSGLLIGDESAPDAAESETESDAAWVDAGTDALSVDTGVGVGTGADVAADAALPPLPATYAAHSLAATCGGAEWATRVSFFTFDEAAGFAEEGTLALSATGCGTLAFDTKRNLYVGCSANPASAQPSEVVVYASGSWSQTPPVRVITAPLIASSAIGGVAVDAAGNVYVAAGSTTGDDAGDLDSAIVVFGPSSDSVPTRVIQGLGMPLESLEGIALDSSDDIWVLCPDFSSLREFAAGADGRVAPMQTLVSPNLSIVDFSALAIGDASRIWLLSSNLVAWYSTSSSATFGGETSVPWPVAVAADDRGNVFLLTGSGISSATAAPGIEAFSGSVLAGPTGSNPAPEATTLLPAVDVSNGSLAVAR